MDVRHPAAGLRWIPIRFYLILTVWAVGADAPAAQQVQATSPGGAPDSGPWKITLVEADEPGLPMLVSGVVYAPDGETPVSGITVHAYHTDARGFYSRDGRSESEHRIQGDMVTNDRGQFEFASIKPASYPNSRVPSHVHFIVSEPGYVSQRFLLEFAGDPHLTPSQIERAEQAGRFAAIRPLVKDEDGVLRCSFFIRLKR